MRSELVILSLLFACAAAEGPVVRAPPLASPGGAFRTRLPPPPFSSFTDELVRGPKSFDLPFPNGLRLVVVQERRRPLVSIRLVLPSGAGTDPPDATGATYFGITLLGDLYEESEPDRPIVGEKSLRRQMVEMGASWASGVDADGTVLGIDGYSRDSGVYLRRLCGAVMHPRRGESSFAYRRNAMLDELDERELNDDETFLEELARTAFGEDHSYGRSPYGHPKDLASLTMEDVVKHQKRILTPRGAVLLVVGDVDPRRINTEVQAACGRWSGGAPPRPDMRPPKVNQRRKVSFIRRSPARTMAFCASQVLPSSDAHEGTLEVLLTVLGHGIDGRLASVLREEHQLAYTASAWAVTHPLARALIACARIRADRADLGIELFLRAIDGLRSAPVSDDELAWAKGVALARWRGAQESLGGVVGLWVQALLLGARPDVAGKMRAIEAVTAADVQMLAMGLLDPSALQIIAAGEPGPSSAAFAGNHLGKVRTVRLLR
ncbi:MAG: insulinase family protein [Deltaproteobacteria bacterium]|nr:insulinase family protein [Deltaproteobacteria bacterium]